MEPKAKQFRKRSAILSCLQQVTCHPSAEELHRIVTQEHPDISLATVYRNLTLFKEQGLVKSLGTVDGTERFDGRLEPHAHLVCGCCGEVKDLMIDLSAPSLLGKPEEGWQVSDVQLMVTGKCPRCQESSETELTN